MKNAKSIILQVAAACLMLFSGASAAATTPTPLDLSPVPLYLKASGVAPNIYLTLDDSGSMAWAFMPDSLGNYPTYTFNRFESSTFNPMYYDPTVTYQPPIGADGSSLGDASFTAAWYDGYNHGAGTVNLASRYRATYSYQPYYVTGSGPGHAYYYQYNPTCGNVDSDRCYKYVDVTKQSTTQQQNFANWFSYYRTRILMAKTAISLAFGKLGSDVRVAGQNINTNKLYPNSPSGVQMLHPFSDTNRSNWFDWLGGVTPYGGTPLREALKHVGEYYSTSGIKSPYAKTPGKTDAPEYSCRQNFSVLMTDGMWNGSTSPKVGNADNKNGPTITDAQGKTYQYTPHKPYEDPWYNTLADVAMHYWDHDLRTDLPNDVPTYLPHIHYQADGVTTDPTATFYDSRNDPADWQHMVTFTIGLGVDGKLDPNTDLPALIAGTKSWPKPVYNTVTTIDDLWHAAIDGRGDYLSAKNPQSLVSAFANIIGAIGQRTSSFSSAALTSGSLQANTQLITATFDGSTWSGDVQATALDSSGNLGSIVWDANCILSGRTGNACVAAPGNTTTQGSRTLLTYDVATGQGIPFQWTDLSASQQKDLETDPDTGVIGSSSLGKQRLKYLSGVRSQEQVNGGPFRSRPGGILGDIVHSAPVYVGPPNRFYYWGSGSPHSAWTASYTQFKKTYAARRPIVYVGANDGMLHGFRDDTGQEVLGFVPSAVFGALNQLTSPNYAHRYYVDSTPTENDVYFTGAAQWRSVLVGGLGGGGKEIYALNVTDPSTFTESNAKNLVLWEFTAAKAPPYGDPNLGDTYSRPAIVLLNNGVWAAVLGNGYNSSCTTQTYCGDAMLYVINIETGKLIRKIDTGVGPAQDPTGKDRPDGLATVEPVDADSNYTTDYVYAGDLYGNLWKFDLSSSDPSQWKVAYGQPLFKAVDAGGNPQPITTRPVVGVNPSGPGFMVYFGTGKYLEKSDAVPDTTTVQSVYGIWDKNEGTLTPITRNDLQVQTITDEVTQFGDQLRVVSSNRINWTQQDGWYLDLKSPVSGAQGEMVVTDPTLRSGKLIFTTLIPNKNLCSSGGNSWLFEINALSGGRLPYSVFDLNDDNTFNSQDYVKVTNPSTGKDTYVPTSGLQSKNGLLSQPAILSNRKGAEYKYLQGSNGKTSKIFENAGPDANGRQSWRQLQ